MTPPPIRSTTRLRQLMAGHGTLFIPGCFDAMSGKMLEQLGFPAIYMSGYGTSLALGGMPDVGLLTMSEMVMNARLIAAAVRVPLIADADTGFGNAINVVRTVREYVGAGVAGIHLEDQISPKRCGHVAGRQVVPLDEAVGKIRAADSARCETDPDFVLIARTDARGAHNGTLDDAILRANAYLEAGADLAFVEGPTSVAEVERVCREVRGPVFYNMTGLSPRFDLPQMQAMGIRIAITGNTLLRACLMAMHEIGSRLRDEGPLAEQAFIETFDRHAVGNLHSFAGFDEVRRMEAAFLPPDDQQKYNNSIGHMPRPAA